MNLKFIQEFNQLKFSISVILLLLISSCGKPHTDFILFSAVNKARIGDTFEKIDSLTNVIPGTVLEYNDSNSKYKVIIYKSCYFDGGVPIYEYYPFLFVNDKLYFWGSLDDFKKCDDKLISKYGLLVSKHIMKNL